MEGRDGGDVTNTWRNRNVPVVVSDLWSFFSNQQRIRKLRVTKAAFWILHTWEERRV